MRQIPSLDKANSSRQQLGMNFCFCFAVILQYFPSVYVPVRRKISLVSSMLSGGSVMTFVCFQRIPTEEGWESRRRRGTLLASEQCLQQNHRMLGVGRGLCGSSSPPPLPKQGHLQQAAQDLVQAGLEYSSPEKDTPQPLWAAWARAPSPSE